MVRFSNKYEFYLPDRYLIDDSGKTRLHADGKIDECIRGILRIANQVNQGYSVREEKGCYYTGVATSSMTNTVMYFFTNSQLSQQVIFEIADYIKKTLRQREIMLTVNGMGYII